MLYTYKKIVFSLLKPIILLYFCFWDNSISRQNINSSVNVLLGPTKKSTFGDLSFFHYYNSILSIFKLF